MGLPRVVALLRIACARAVERDGRRGGHCDGPRGRPRDRGGRECRNVRRHRGEERWRCPHSCGRAKPEHLIEHLLAAGRAAEAEELAADLRWAGARLQLSGPAGPYADLARIGTPRAQRLARVLGQAAHLLAPADPPHSLIDILYSRVSYDPDWGAQAQALAASRKLPALISKWPLPDLPDPALRRVLTGRAGRVNAVAIAPDGTWLATADGGSVRIWDPATAGIRAAMRVDRPLADCAWSPSGQSLVVAGDAGLYHFTFYVA